MTDWPVYRTPEQLAQAVSNWRKQWHSEYLVMFSSYWGGFVTDPALWGVPPDDHMVHRGDAVFEAFKSVNGRVYCLEPHLTRLKNSAQLLELTLPPAFDQAQDIIRQAYQLGGVENLLIRLNVSRGPGSFAVNPYDAPQSQLYLTTSALKRPPAPFYQHGVTAISSPFPAQTYFATIKSCNYLQQVLAKKAAIDAGADYVISFDHQGFLTEGATENAAVITKSGELLAPCYDRILKGVTLGRVLAHAQDLIKTGLLKSASQRNISKEEMIDQAQEIFFTGTTFDLLAVTTWDGKPVGDGQVGPVARELTKRLEAEIHGDNQFTTDLKSGSRPSLA
ncbi:MAG: aminotransferase class IV [Deltaproteobacteria bacterium]|jgi:branched-chain amino acid aminotransferase|nr:aminotransferase class IV [Deltaproteobacteria bacterium]